MRGIHWSQMIAVPGGAALAMAAKVPWPVYLIGGAVYLAARYLRHLEVQAALRIGHDAVARSAPNRIPEVMDSVGAVVGSAERDAPAIATGQVGNAVSARRRRGGDHR